ncbi:MAG: 4Fe-4S binding protein [Clostridia bacterium]|nr:4Fe-4S binding protein [Clostridia bacterium]
MLKFKKVWGIYFSPTLTTRKLVNAIVDGTGIEEKDYYDFTKPKMRQSFPEIEEGDLVVFGMPTYAGRLPNTIVKYFDKVKGNGAYAAAVVTFGNRAFDNSLIELKTKLEEAGFTVISGAAFATEHSFSYEINEGRPDFDDLDEAIEYGLKLTEIENVNENLNIPGDKDALYFKPHEKSEDNMKFLKVKPKTNDKCTFCMSCARNCPMGAINPENPTDIMGICIKCNACVKRCNVQAKYFDDPIYLKHKTDLEEKYSEEEKENQFFF